MTNHGNLQNCSKQGVLLLNTILNVIKDQANSHNKIGWNQFTNKIIESIRGAHILKIFIISGNELKS
jgi:uracil-DNA glycosylase